MKTSLKKAPVVPNKSPNKPFMREYDTKAIRTSKMQPMKSKRLSK